MTQTTKELRPAIEKIIKECLDYNADEDSFDGYEEGSPEWTDNRYEWTKRIEEQNVNKVIKLFQTLQRSLVEELEQLERYEYMDETMDVKDKFKYVVDEDLQKVITKWKQRLEDK